jgi:hypothetical protein
MLVNGNKNAVAAQLVADRPGLVELSVSETAKC